MKNNGFVNKSHWVYFVGFSIILALPILTIPPYFFPPDWGKTIIFRSILAIFLLLFTYQFFYKKQDLDLPSVKNNKIIWALSGLFGFFFLASIFSVDPYFSFFGSPVRSGGFINFAFYIIFAIFTFFIIKESEWKKLWNFAIFTGIGVSFVALIQYFGLFKTIFATFQNRPPSTIGNPILLGIYILLLLFVTLVFFIKEKRLLYKVLYGIAIALFLFVILISESRAAYLGCVIGSIYFLLSYPKKLPILKITIGILLLIIGGFIFYANTIGHFPAFLEKNRLFQSVQSRLSVNSLLSEGRFPAWPVGFRAFLEKPLLGWGPENYSVGFDKHYTPSAGAEWWDRAHNVPLEIAATAGLPALICYLALFIILFWQLRKVKLAKKNTDQEQNTESILMAHGIQATLIAYFIANLFSFDSFSTYILFFFIIGYSLYLTNTKYPEIANVRHLQKYKKTILAFLFVLLVWFLWQYNIVPFYINAEVNKASDFVKQKNCAATFITMNKELQNHSFLDSYVRLEYGEFIKNCNDYYPQNSSVYMKKGLEVIGQALKMQPLYTRYWIFMASATNSLAAKETNADTKNNLITQAKYYLDQAIKLAPNHQEIIIEQARMEMNAGDYQKMQSYSNDCIALNADLGDCYWELALSQIYLKDINNAQKNIEIAGSKGYSINSEVSLGQLADAYYFITDYRTLASIYEKLIIINQSSAQYHSSLAFFYSKLGEYAKARHEAMEALKRSPESKPNVDAFLRTLPY